MRTIDVASNLHYEVVGAHEEEAAYLLEECLTAVNKRRNAYVESEIEDIIRSEFAQAVVHTEPEDTADESDD